MKISELPQEIREKALKYQKDTTPLFDKNTDDLMDAFNWLYTKEGVCFWSQWYEKEPEIPQDQNVLEVIESFKRRSEVGFKKYGINTERTDIDLLGWLNHLQEELMDATIYIQRLKKEYENKN
jgi:hypothetical protein